MLAGLIFHSKNLLYINKKAMNHPLLSVIVPVHNGEKYLEQCFQSLSSQTVKDIEIIVVDDASVDNSWRVIKKWADRDSRFCTVRNTEPSGSPGIPRNQGLKIAAGKYIGFVDCDDWVEKDYFENFRILFSGDDEIIQSAGFYEHRGNKCKRTIFEYPFYENKNLKKFIRGNSIWDKIYDRNFLLTNNIFLGTTVACVDIPFVIKAGFHHEKTRFVPYVGYHYRRGIKGSTISLRESTNCEFVLNVWNEICRWAKDIGVEKQYMNLIHFKMTNNLLYTLTVINYKYFKNFYLTIREIISSFDVSEIISMAKCMGYENYIKKRVDILLTSTLHEYVINCLVEYRNDIALILQTD